MWHTCLQLCVHMPPTRAYSAPGSLGYVACFDRPRYCVALQMEDEERLLMHCCASQASLFRFEQRNMFSVALPVAKYTAAPIKAMVLAGVSRMLVAYDVADETSRGTCRASVVDARSMSVIAPQLQVFQMLANLSVPESSSDQQAEVRHGWMPRNAA